MKNNLEPLYVLNPLLLNDFKYYILGNGKAASQLFVQLCSSFVKIDGFICDEYKGTTLWHKPVLSFDDIRGCDNVICITTRETNDKNTREKGIIYHDPMILNPEFDKNQAVIFGAGMIGVEVLHFLRNVNIEVICFIDSNKKLVGNKVEDVLVRDITYLTELSENTYVIEAGKYYKEIDEIVTKYVDGNKRFFLETPYGGSSNAIFVDSDIDINLKSVMFLEEFFEERNLYLYGDYELSKKYQAVMEMLGFTVGIIRDTTDNTEEMCIEDLLYEENYLILLVEGWSKLINKLECLGFREAVDYVWIENPYIFYNFSRNEMLDMNLGYTYIMNEEYPGIKILGNNNADDYKIAVLGGSTTDSEACTVTSWVDFLYSKCEKYSVTIFNGGTDGYTSTMELIKLLRDILSLNPDMVIVYDGVNDAVKLTEKPYEFAYLKRALSFAGTRQAKNLDNGKQAYNAVWSRSWAREADRNECQINSGFSENRTPFDIWLNNMELMYAISRSRGINFFSFLQPMLLSKKESALTLRDKSWINAEYICRHQRAIDAQKNFRKLMTERKVADTHDYMYDLSAIFDTEDVYMDFCHVYEHGNHMIAEEIWKIIKKYVVQQNDEIGGK